jgi:hypothetical protein
MKSLQKRVGDKDMEAKEKCPKVSTTEQGTHKLHCKDNQYFDSQLKQATSYLEKNTASPIRIILWKGTLVMKQTTSIFPNSDGQLIFTITNKEIISESRSQEVAYRFPILFQHYFNFEVDPIQNERVHLKGGIE